LLPSAGQTAGEPGLKKGECLSEHLARRAVDTRLDELIRCSPPLAREETLMGEVVVDRTSVASGTQDGSPRAPRRIHRSQSAKCTSRGSNPPVEASSSRATMTLEQPPGTRFHVGTRVRHLVRWRGRGPSDDALALVDLHCSGVHSARAALFGGLQLERQFVGGPHVVRVAAPASWVLLAAFGVYVT